jgi:hypothetical protein
MRLLGNKLPSFQTVTDWHAQSFCALRPEEDLVLMCAWAHLERMCAPVVMGFMPRLARATCYNNVHYKC